MRAIIKNRTYCGDRVYNKHPQSHLTIADGKKQWINPEEQQIIYERNLKLMDLSTGYDYYPDEVPVYEEQLNNCKNHKGNYNKFLEEAKKLNMWSIVRNYTSWRESFNNNENIINIINKAIKNATKN